MGEGTRRWSVVGAEFVLAVGALIAAGAGPAIGSDATVAELKARAASRGTAGARGEALRDLAELGTADARRALEELAGARDDQLAAHACLAIGRADLGGGRAKLKQVYEDTARPHGVRVAAFLAWARVEAAGGASWSAIETYAKRHYAAGSRLESSVQAARNALFPASGAGEEE